MKKKRGSYRRSEKACIPQGSDTMQVEPIYRVVLFGHRDFDGHEMLDERLCALLKKLLKTQPFLEIYIGRNGEFDRYAASAVKRMRHILGEERIALYCVLPYPCKDMEYYERYYDGVIVPTYKKRPHPKSAIGKRNRFMAERADLVVCYVEREEGGAYAAVRYAQQCGKSVANLAQNE